MNIIQVYDSQGAMVFGWSVAEDRQLTERECQERIEAERAHGSIRARLARVSRALMRVCGNACE